MIEIIHSREELNQLIINMKSDGWSIRGLGRRFKMSRNTIRSILRTHANQRNQGHDVLLPQKNKTLRKSKLDPFVPKIKELLEEFPQITGQRVLEELHLAGYTGGKTILRERLKILRPKPKKKPTVRFETDPGYQGQMDWSPYTISFTDEGKKKVQCFSYILGFSRRHYIDFTYRRDFYTMIRRHQDAFNHFGGVPKTCLYDSEKTVVLRWEAGKPVCNPAFVAFITHYGVRPVICARGRAQTKGKVEAPFQFVENNLLNGRKFKDFNELREVARWWLANKSDPHLHETTGRMPLELFLESEQRNLKPLPLHAYDSAEVALRVCSIDAFLDFEGNRYSVPFEYCCDILTMKATDEEIIVYSAQIEEIACHERVVAGSGAVIELPEHRGSKLVRYGLESVRDSFLALGCAAETFIDGLQRKQPRNSGFHARYILQLKGRYHTEAINKALNHANRYYAFDCKAVERILRVKATPRTLESVCSESVRQELRKALPEIKQRPLSQYVKLFKQDDGKNE